ncbi:MAG: site-2 protease family protein [Acidobacteriota bacterium]
MNLDPSLVTLGLTWMVVFLFSTTCHEAAHAWAALRLGDPTAYHGGQVTLDPLPHIKRSPFGMILMPILSFALMGWMIGWASAPYDPRWSLRYPKRAALMALAGPVSNLILLVLALIGLKVGLASGSFVFPDELGFDRLVMPAEADPTTEAFGTFLSVAASLNLLLFIFNLIPVPPLDGSAVVQLAMPDDLARRYQEFLWQPMISLLGILIAWRLLEFFFFPAFLGLVRLLHPI